MKDQLLNAEIKDGKLTVSIGVEALEIAASVGRSFGMGEVEITDTDAFLAELPRYIRSEEEDGSTRFHRMIDECVSEMIENGETGVRYEDE
jgi:hypothetical protein